MKKNKLVLLIASSMLLSSCSLFNDSDLEKPNSYNPPITSSEKEPPEASVNGVDAQRVEGLDGILVFKNVGYADENEEVKNSYKTDFEYKINDGKNYFSNVSNNNYDLYVPDSLNKSNKQTVILFIHGGAWVTGFKTDVNPYVHEFAKRGYITATIKYTLLKKSMNDKSLSIFRNLDEIDACIGSIKASLKELGFNNLDLIIGGASSGAHLAMLYTYSRGDKCPLPIKFVVDAVGPTNIKEDSWKAFKEATDEVLNNGITKSAIDTQRSAGNLKALDVSGEGYTWCEYQTMRIANGMCGIPYSLETVEASSSDKITVDDPTNEAYVSMTKANGGEDLLSVTHYISSTSKFPIICAYSGKDSVVGIAQYATLEESLIANGVTHEYFYFKDSGHTDIDKDTAQYNAFISKIDEWAKKDNI